MPKYSIVVPLHNEQENVTDLYDRLKAVMEANGESFELVLVDDGSTDRSLSTCCAKLPLSIAGSRSSNCAATSGRLPRWLPASITPAANTSSPWMAICSTIPADIPMFLEKISEGYDIVSGWRKHRIDNLLAAPHSVAHAPTG